MNTCLSAKQGKIFCTVLALIVLVLDQSSKSLVLHYLHLGQSKPWLPFLSFTLAHNHGIAFGELASLHGWQSALLLMAVIAVIGCLAVWLYRLESKDFGLGLALSAILGGALGNLIDRLSYGYVVDFIDFHIAQWHWFVFNIADVAISLGVMWMIGLMLFGHHDASTDSTGKFGNSSNVS